MSKFPIICGILGKKLYLTLLLAATVILHTILKDQIPRGNDIELINNLGGNILEMLSVFIPCIFKLKDKSKTSSKKCTKSNFKDYFILFLITILFIGINYFIEYLDINAISISNKWISLCLQMICYFILSIIILKTKYYTHNIISMIFFCIFTVIIELFFGKLIKIKLTSFIYFLPNLVDNILCCYMKYLIDKKYHSYWNILFFTGLFYFIIDIIYFIIIIIIDPYNNSIFNTIRKAKEKYFIVINVLLSAIFEFYLRTLITLLILEYFSFNHALISYVLTMIVVNLISIIYNYALHKMHLFFLIPAVFQILSLLFFLEILEFNFCNLNRNTKRNIMLREEEEMLLRNNSIASKIEVEVDKDLIVKNPQEKKDLELYDIIDNSEEKAKIRILQKIMYY